jgi:hypothetical protein
MRYWLAMGACEEGTRRGQQTAAHPDNLTTCEFFGRKTHYTNHRQYILPAGNTDRKFKQNKSVQSKNTSFR